MQKIILLLSISLLAQNIKAQPCTESAPGNGGPVIVQFQQARQSFTAGCSGTISSISFDLFTSFLAPPTTPISIELRSIGGGICSPGAVLATTNATPIFNGTNTYTFASPPLVSMGTQYVLNIIGGAPSFVGWFGAAPSNMYLGGGVSAYNNGAGCTANNYSWEFSVDIVGTPLPASLTSFLAQASDKNTVQLSWETATEINCDRFLVEKSRAGTNWTEIQSIDAQGASNSSIQYKTEDPNPYEGISYYRLKQIDMDNSYTTSDVKSVFVQRQDEIFISPNPATDNIIINGNARGKEIELYTTTGKRVTSTTTIKQSQRLKTNLDISSLTKGIYFLRVGNKTHKIIKN